jgi:hypothetical protein
MRTFFLGDMKDFCWVGKLPAGSNSMEDVAERENLQSHKTR